MSRPALTLQGETTRIETPVGTAYITVNTHEGKPVEVIVSLGKNGADERASAEAIGRLISTALQSGVELAPLTKQLRGISSTVTLGFGPNKVLSVPDAVGRVLQTYLKEEP